ncbi:retrotransposon protein, putative, ty1-copia subclass [Tanacetum coccineum]
MAFMWFDSPRPPDHGFRRPSEQPIPPAPAADSAANVLAKWNAIYDAHNEVACLILGSRTPELHRQFKNSSPYEMLQELKPMFEKQARVERFDLIQTFHACKQEEGKPTIGELHALLIEYEKGLPKKAFTPQVMAIQCGRIQKANKKSQNAKGKGKGKGKGKDKSYVLKPKNLNLMLKSTRIRSKLALPVLQALRGARKLKQGNLYLYVGNGVHAQVEAIGSFDLVLPNGLVIYLDNCHYAPSIIRGVVSVSRLVENGFVQCFTDYGILVSRNNVLYAIPSNGIYEIDMSNSVPNVNSIYNVSNKRVKHNLDSTGLWHCHYALESAARILNMVPTKKVDKTPYELWFGKVPNLITKGKRTGTIHFPPENKIVVARYAEFFEKNLLSQEVSGRAGELEEIQDGRYITSEKCTKYRNSYGEVEEHSLGDVNEPANYKAAMLGQESNNKWIFKKKTDMDGNVHTYKARLVAKGFTQTYEVDYEETYHPMRDIRAIRILIAIAAFYDYKIWQMDVKTAFLNGYLDEDIYMMQPEGFIDPKHPRKQVPLFSKNNVHYFNAIPSNGIYEIDMHDLVPNNNSIYNVSTKRAKRNLDSTYLWHCRLAHISKKRIEKLQQEGLLRSTDDESFDQCVSCLSGKMTRKSFPHHPERATDLLGIIHTDVCGPLRHVSRQGASYFITFTDDYSRYGYIYLLKHKHEVFKTFKVFKNEVENQLGKTIKAHRSDRGGKYISQEFKDYLKACGIVQQLTPPYIPQHNGVSERRNHTLLNMVRSMMNLTTLPLSFWDYALESATRILNMVSTKKVDKTPYELWYGKVPNLSYLKVWGCEALVKRDTPDKLQQRSVMCVFIGYPKETMGYYFYFPPENKIVVARYAEFFEKNLITQKVSGRAEGLEEIQDEDTSPSKITSEIPMEVEEVEEHSLGDLNEPTSYKSTMLYPESDKWIDAMNAEMQSMIDNMVWVLVDLPPNCKTVGKTFSLVTDIGAIRILISIAAFYDYEIWQMDVKTAFLNGHLDEDIYMVQPEGFVDPKHPRKVCKLQRSIYSLKMDNSKRGHIPMQERLDLNKTQVRCTRPDVAFAKNITSRFQQNPAELRVECYCDVGFETDRDDTKSQTGYVFILNGGAVD